MAKDKAKNIANKEEKLQVDTNSSVPENAPVDGEVKEPKDAKEGNETKKDVEEKPLDNNDTISELQKQILENGLEGLEETAAGGPAAGAEGGVSLSAAAFEQGGHESNIRETFREVDPYGHPVDLNGLMGGNGISGSTTPPRDTTPPNEPKIEIDHPNGKVIITPDPLTTEGGDTTTINYTDDNGNSKSATYTKGSDGEWHLIDKDNFPHMPENSESGKIIIPDEAVKDNTEIISFSTDKVGNKSSEAKDITPDITPPEVTIDKITLYDTDVRANDSVEKIRVTGHSDERDGILKIYDKDDNLIYTGSTDSNGNFDVEIVTNSVSKFENVTARVTDKSNNTGSDTKDSGGYIEHSDKTAPKVSDIETFSTDKSTPADGVSDETRITFKVDDPTVTAKVVIEGHEYDANNNGDGTWSVTVPGFKEGTIVDVIATDGAGNKGSASAKVGGIDHFDDVTPPNDPVVSATNDGGAIVTPTSDYRVGDKVIVSFTDEQGNSVIREYTKGSNNEWSDNNGHSSVGGVIKINEDEIKDFSTISAKDKDIAGNFSNEVTAVVSEDPIPDMSTTVITQTSARVSEGEVATYKIELPRSIRHDASFEFNIEHITTVDEDLGKPRFTNGVRLSEDGTKVIVPAGVKEFNVEIDVLNDNIVESDEKFSLNFAGNSVTTTVVNTSTDVITNHGDTNLNFTGAEGTSHLTNFEVAPKTMDATYKITTENITASDSDYRVSVVPTEGVIDNGNGTITLKAGQTHFTLKTDYIADNLIETNKAETFKVKVVNTATGESIEGTKTINDIDNSNNVYVNGGDNSYTENGTNYGMNGNSAREGFTANFNVRLDKASDGEQRFSYETVKDGLIDIDTDHVTFTNGVKLSEDGHSVIVPAGVKDFTVSYNTTKNDLVDKDTAFTLKINGVSYDMRVLNYEETNINGPENGSVPSAVEGNKVVFNVDMGKAASYEKSYDYTQSLVDTSVADYKFDGTTPTGNAFWPTFTNGVRLSDDGHSVIVPAGVKSWTMKYDTFDDHLSERDESFSFKIHTATARGTIVDNDAITHADIIGYDHTNGDVANGSDGIAMEGKTLTYDITLSGIDVDNRNYNVSFNYANGANIYDINSISCETVGAKKVTFTRTSDTSGYFTVPAGVNSFKMLIKTTDDSTYEEDELINFRILDANATATIINDDPIPNAYIYTLQTAAVTEGQDLVYTAKTSFTTLKEQRFAYKLSLNGETNKDTDNPDMVVEPKFSNGVYLDKATNEIVVPKGTSEFTVTYKTIADGIIEVPNSDKVALTLGGTSTEATILNKDIPTADAEGGVGYENPNDETRGAIVYDKATNRFSVDSTATASNEITYKFTLHGNFGAGVEDTLYFYAKNVRIASNTGNTWEGGLELEKYPLSFSKDGGQTWSKHTITGTWKDGDEVLVKVALRDSTPNELWRNPTDRLLNEGEAHPDVADQTYHGSEYARNGWLKEIPGRLTFGKLGYSIEAVGYKVDNDDMVYIAEKNDEAVNLDTKSGNDSIRISADLPNKDNHINSGDADDKIYVQGMNPDGSNIKLAGTIDGGLGRDSFSNDLYSKVELTDNLNLIGFTSASLYVTDTTDKVVHFTQNEANGEGHYTVGGKILGDDSRVIIDNNTTSPYYMDFAKSSEISHIEANGGWTSVGLFGSNKVGDVTINSNNGGEFYTYAPNNRISGDINLTENSSRRYNFNMNGKNTVNGDINLNFTKEELDPNINWHWDVKYFTESYAKNVTIKGVNDSQKTDLHNVSITSGKNSMLAMDFNYLNIDGNLDVNSHGRNNFTFYNTVVTGDLNVASGDTDLAYAMYRGTSSANQNKYNWYNVTIKGDANVAMDGHSNYFNLDRVSVERGLTATANNSSTDSFVVRNSKNR